MQLQHIIGRIGDLPGHGLVVAIQSQSLAIGHDVDCRYKTYSEPFCQAYKCSLPLPIKTYRLQIHTLLRR